MATMAGGAADRKMSAGRVFERAFATIRHNPGVTLGLALIFGALPGLLTTYLLSLVRNDVITGAEGVGAAAGFAALSLLSTLMGLVIAALVQGVLTRATIAQSEGRKASFGEGVSAAMAVLLPLIALSILLALGVGLGFILLFVPGVILYIMWSVAAPALIVERRGVFASFGRSRALTKGARWKVFGVMLVLLVIYYLISAVAGLLGYGIYGLGQEDVLTTGAPVGLLILSVIIATIGNLVWGTVQASLYVELRDWKDGPAVENLEDVFR